jgi:hypothetical protein
MKKIKIESNNIFLEHKKQMKEMRIQDQIKELRETIPEQGFFKRRIILTYNGDIEIRDRRYSSLSSEHRRPCLFIKNGFCMVDFWPLQKTIMIADSRLFEFIKTFANKYGYEKIRTEFQL